MADGYIHARKGELIAALAAEGGLAEAEALRFPVLARILSAILHHEAHDALEMLKDLYAPLDPDAPPARRATGEAPLAKFEAALVSTLTAANFVEHAEEISDEGRTRLIAELKLKTSDAGIRSIRYFTRGEHVEQVEVRSWFGLRKKKIDAECVHDVVVLVAFKEETDIKKRERRAFAKMRRGVRPGAVMVKHFRNIARAELISLHPGATPAMRRQDQVFMLAPAVVGGAPILLQLWPALTVLFGLISLYFGTRDSQPENADLHRAIAALSGLIAVGAFVLRQKMKYERQTLLYQKRLADTVYFRNLANNAGVLDALVSAGEEQDVKEALIAYWALRRAGGGLTKAEIDKAAEEFLRTRFALAVDFEIGDALSKLERLGLVELVGETYRAHGAETALARLDAAWDAYFKYGAARPAAAE